MESGSVLALLVVGLVGAFALLRVLGRKKPSPGPGPGPGPGPTPDPDIPAPVAYPPVLVGSLDWKGKVLVDFRYREHGCDGATGEPTLISGAFDPSGGELEHLIDVTGPNKNGKTVSYAVFGRVVGSGNDFVRVDGRWVRFPIMRHENEALTILYIGNEKDDPGHPVFIRGCGPTPLPPNPAPTPDPIGTMEVRYRVRNASGKVSESLARVTVTAEGCS
jgi:hypothetical protein